MAHRNSHTVEQAQAINSKASRIIVLSPPGTGKTDVVTSRFISDTEKNGPDSVIAISFTRKAASEIADRLALQGLTPSPRFPSSGTFHSVSLMILSLANEHGQYNGPMVLATETTTDLLISQIYSTRASEDTLLSRQKKSQKKATMELRQNLEYVKRSGYIPTKNGYLFLNGQVVETVRTFPTVGCTLHTRLVAYQETLASMNLLDYNDALIEATRILSQPGSRDLLFPNLKTLIVDEYQDSNAINEMMIRILSQNITLMCCCDDDQSIYHWRGARPGLVHDFTKTWNGAEKIVLKKNFRSPDAIRIIGDNLMTPVPNRTAKTREQERENATDLEKSVTVHTYNPPVAISSGHIEINSDIADFTAKTVHKLILSGEKPESIAILARTHDAIKEIGKALARRKITYLASNPNKTSSPEIAHLQAWLEVLNGTNLIHSVATLCRTDPTNRLLRDYNEIAGANGMTLPQHLSALNKRRRLRSENMIIFANKFDTYTKMVLTKPMASVFEQIAGDILTTFSTGMTQTREGIFWNAYGILLPIIQSSIPGDFRPALTTLSTAISEDQLVKHEGAVSVSTIHHMKGRQAPNIVLCALADNIIPSAMALRNGKRSLECDEDRRLTYVAYTRVMKHLHIITIKNVPSMFLDDTFRNLKHPAAPKEKINA